MLSAAVNPKAKHQNGDKAWERQRKRIDRFKNTCTEHNPMPEELEKCKAREALHRTNECLSLQFLRIEAWWKNIVHARSTSRNV